MAPKNSGMPKRICSAMDLAELGGDPEELTDERRITLPAGLGEVEAGRDVQAHAQVLEQDRHQVRQQDDPEQCVAVLRTAGEVGSPVARIHVTDGDEETRTDETEETTERAQAGGVTVGMRFACSHQRRASSVGARCQPAARLMDSIATSVQRAVRQA
jgi:hypothetical protein